MTGNDYIKAIIGEREYNEMVDALGVELDKEKVK
jgi:hypothetical protein